MFMNIVSLLGYSYACIALAAILACAWTRRVGVALIVSVALTAALTDIAKATWRAPRPESVDARVHPLSFWQLRRGPDTAPEADAEDGSGSHPATSLDDCLASASRPWHAGDGPGSPPGMDRRDGGFAWRTWAVTFGDVRAGFAWALSRRPRPPLPRLSWPWRRGDRRRSRALCRLAPGL